MNDKFSDSILNLVSLWVVVIVPVDLIFTKYKVPTVIGFSFSIGTTVLMARYLDRNGY